MRFKLTSKRLQLKSLGICQEACLFAMQYASCKQCKVKFPSTYTFGSLALPDSVESGQSVANRPLVARIDFLAGKVDPARSE